MEALRVTMFLAAGIVVAVVRRRDRANIVSVSSFVEMRLAVLVVRSGNLCWMLIERLCLYVCGEDFSPAS